MTVEALLEKLISTLSQHLGRYTDRSTGEDRGPAVFAGNPPSTYQPSGIEVVVESYIPDDRAVHSGVVIPKEWSVRVIIHEDVGMDAVERVLRRISQSFNASRPLLISTDLSLGILHQYTLRIRS